MNIAFLYTLNASISRIVIDPGHGGKDTGAILFTKKPIFEKNLTLKLAKLIKSKLLSFGIDTVLTRNTDQFLDLKQRTEIANLLEPDLFLSLHFNGGHGMGPETFVLSEKTPLPIKYFPFKGSIFNQWVDPPLFNKTDLLKKNKAQSIKFAHLIQQTACNAYKKYLNGCKKSRPIKEANFWVLYAVDAPAILFEAGFLNQPKELHFFQTQLTQYAHDLASSIHKFFKQ